MEKHTIAVNPRKTKEQTRAFVKECPLQEYDALTRSGRLKQLEQRINGSKDGEEQKRLKGWLPFRCPHYTRFRDDYRDRGHIVAESFTWQTCIDIDDAELVEKANEMSDRLDVEAGGKWQGLLLHKEYSIRRKLHIDIRLPMGMTVPEAQREYCKALGVKCDTACFTPERFIYLSPADFEIYRADGWYEQLPEEEVALRRKAYTDRGLSIDGRTESGAYYDKEASPALPSVACPSKKISKEGDDKTDNNPRPALPSTASPDPACPPSEGLGEASTRTLYIFDACMKEAELTPEVLIVEGHRHEALKSILSVGATQLLTKEELLDVLKVRMAQNWQDKNIRQLVDDFYTKYHDPSQKMTLFQRRVLARSLKTHPHPTVRGVDNSGHEMNCVQSNNSSPLGEAGWGLSLPPLPKRLPPLIRLLTQNTPDIYKAAVAHAVFPPLAAHLHKTRFRYIDNVEHEATLMNVLMAGTGAGKDCISAPINHIMADIRRRDAESLAREKAWKQSVNTRGANKDKAQRPEGLVIQEIDADVTNAAFVQRMAEADEHFLYVKLNEIDQFDALRGNGSKSGQQFQIMCLAFDPNNRYGQTRVGTMSVTEKVCIRFNWNAATTIQKGQRYFRNVLTDGPISRINFCTIPEREIGAEMPVYGTYDNQFDEQLRPYIERLTSARGLVDCPQAYRLAVKLKNECAEFSRLSQSRVYENLSFRANVIAYLKACILYVAHGNTWTKDMEAFVRWSLQYDLWCKMHFFGEAIEQANDDSRQQGHRGPRNLLQLLPDEFTLEQAVSVRQQQGLSREGTKDMIRVWRNRGYIEAKAPADANSEANEQLNSFSKLKYRQGEQ